MDKKFLNKYRIPSTRATWWNYGNNAAYFITICTAQRICFFGDIMHNHSFGSSGKRIQLTEIGKIVQNEWLKTPEIRPDLHLTMDAWVVMPDHFHGIIVIGENEYNRNNDKSVNDIFCRDAMHGVSNVTETIIPFERYGPQCKNLASIIRGFKSAVTMQARRIQPGFAWQERYYDHIIRDEDSLNRIRHYILANVENWNTDTFH